MMSNESPLLCSEEVAEAKKKTARRIRRDQSEATEDVAALLEVIGERLYDLAFDVTELGTVCPLDAEAVWRFNFQTGLHPRVYIDRRRLETAFELVRHSSTPVSEIALSLGFRTTESFTKWFKWRTGQAPLKLRAARSVRPMRKVSGWAVWRKILMLHSNDEECRTLLSSLTAYTRARIAARIVKEEL